MELKKILQILLRRKWIISQAFLVIFITALLSCLFLPRVYEASSSVMIGRAEAASSLLSNLGMDKFQAGGNEVNIENYLELSTTDSIIEKLIKKLQLRDRDGNYLEAKTVLKSVPILANIIPRPCVQVSLVSETAELLEITASSTDAETTAMIADTLGNILIDETFFQQRKEYEAAKNYVELQVKSTKQDYLNILSQIKDFQINNKVVRLETEINSAINRLQALLATKESTTQELFETKAKIEVFHAQFKESRNGNAIPSSVIQKYPRINELKVEISGLEKELAE
ncbi:MAG: hypothetical protein D3916_13885, partial [Candidatus Electrothrix sp. MAN1_4]|nr:hypothetical protein [Candidatus Electrothrix sp. MAN1_4]